MKARVQKWGNSLAVRIPKAFAVEIGLSAETPVEVSIREGNLVIEPAPDEEAFTLEQLVAGITEENRHPETDWGPPVGNEVW